MLGSPSGGRTLVTIYVKALQQPAVLGEATRQPYHPPVMETHCRCDVEGMSALPPKADICSALAHFCWGISLARSFQNPINW